MLDTFLSMDPTTIAAFMAAALVLYLTPGADMMFTLASGLSGGPRAGLAAAIGICLGILTHTVIAAAGIAALIAASPATYDALRYLGAAYLLWLAWSAWHREAPREIGQGARQIRRAMFRGYVTNILNPKVALFILAFLPQFTDPSIGPIWQQILILGTLLTLGGIVTDGSYGIAAGLMAEKLRAASTTMNKLSALVFGGLAARLALD